LKEKTRIIRLLRAKDIDMAIMLNPSKDFNIITYLAGIPVRVGYGRKFGFLLTNRMKDEKHLGLKHEVEYNLELAALAGAHTQDKSLSLNIDKKAADTLLKKSGVRQGDVLVAIHPWTSDPVKQWPLENFISLIDRFSKEPAVKVIIVGGKEEAVKSQGFFNGLGVNVVNLSGKTTLSELGALLKASKALISADSGPVHLAASVGIPAVAIFRNDIPGKTPKRWGPWGERHIVIEKNNPKDITVDEVFECTKKFLS
jgi:ADP-heptose:LPS heptosyltransferase